MRIYLALWMLSALTGAFAQTVVDNPPSKPAQTLPAAPAAASPPAAVAVPAAKPVATSAPTSAAASAKAEVDAPLPTPAKAPIATPVTAPATAKVAPAAPVVAAAPVGAAVAAGTAAAAPPPAGAANAAPVPAAVNVVRGQLSLTSGGRPLRSDEAADAVVYFRPATAVPVTVPDAPFVLVTERKTFVPRVLPIPVGAAVRFPNNDPILHNVFSTTKEAAFDLGLYGRSEGENYRFTQPGVIRVYCNVHHAMVAHVLVMDTPFFTKPDAQGRFRLIGVPAGPGELLVWHERAQLWRQSINVSADVDLQVPLELSKRKIPPHLNKTGQPYRRTRPDEY